MVDTWVWGNDARNRKKKSCRASWRCIWRYKVLFHSETLPVEYLSGKPLCMDQYYQILSSCRIPGPKRDTVVNYAIGKVPSSHITVVHNFQVLSNFFSSITWILILWFNQPGISLQFFVLDVYNSDGSPLTVDQLHMQLEKIWNSSLQTNKEPIGILTSQHRNTWGKAYNNLIKGGQSTGHNNWLWCREKFARQRNCSSDKTNKESVRAIQKSIFTVCLDAPMPRVSDEMYQSRVAAQMLHGGGARWNSGNRWFDKTLQVSVSKGAGSIWKILKSASLTFITTLWLNFYWLAISFSLWPQLKCVIRFSKQTGYRSKNTNYLC